MATHTSTYARSEFSRSDRSDAAPYIAEPTRGSPIVFPPAHPLRWFGAFICAVALYFIVLSAAGALING